MYFQTEDVLPTPDNSLYMPVCSSMVDVSASHIAGTSLAGHATKKCQREPMMRSLTANISEDHRGKGKSL